MSKNSIENLVHKIILHNDEWWWPVKDRSASVYFGNIEHYTLPEKLIKLCGENKKAVVQAGGHVGMYANMYSKEFESVYTFEPNFVNYYCLNLNAPYANVYKFRSCLGETNESVILRNSKKNSGAHHIDLNTKEPGVIPVLTIDNLGLNYCDLIHLDIEGYEYYAIKGALQTIETYKPIICLETNAAIENNTNLTLDKLDTLLYDIGYKISDRTETDTIYIPT